MDRRSPHPPYPVTTRALRRTLFGGLLTCSLLLAGGCDKEPPPQPQVVRPVKMLTIEGPGAVQQREYPATVKATQQADMGFEVPGRIVEFLVKEGQIVESGEVLARLDDRDYQAELEKAKANQRKALADLNRSLSIYREDPGAISTGAIDSDRRAKEVTDAAVQQAEKAVEEIYEAVLAQNPDTPAAANNLAFYYAEHDPTPENLEKAEKLLASI